MRLLVAAEHRRRGIGSMLYDRALAFAAHQKAEKLTATYFEDKEAAESSSFLAHRGFEPFERYCPASLDLSTFDSARYRAAYERVTSEGIRLRTWQDTGDQRRQLHRLECRARSKQPFREVADYVAPSFEEWSEELDADHVVVAESIDGSLIGMVKGVESMFTGVDPDWQGRGVATALKVFALDRAKAMGLSRTVTENHEDNHAMRAINSKLGYVADPVEVNCVKYLSATRKCDPGAVPLSIATSVEGSPVVDQHS